MTLVQDIPVPVIAMVNGVATAAGCQLVASCDIAVATEMSTFATPGINVGLFCSTPGVAIGRAVPRKVRPVQRPSLVLKRCHMPGTGVRFPKACRTTSISKRYIDCHLAQHSGKETDQKAATEKFIFFIFVKSISAHEAWQVSVVLVGDGVGECHCLQHK